MSNELSMVVVLKRILQLPSVLLERGYTPVTERSLKTAESFPGGFREVNSIACNNWCSSICASINLKEAQVL
jgi:hypothetical protein